jgi:hypothetical protein
MALPAAPETISAEADRVWRQIAAQFREACILRRQGRYAASAKLMEGELQPLIRDWFTLSGVPAEIAKERLAQLFNEEQARVESNWIIARFLADDPNVAAGHTRRLAAFAAGAASTGTWYPAIAPRQIPLDDVVDMIDAARASERLVPHAIG